MLVVCRLRCLVCDCSSFLAIVQLCGEDAQANAFHIFACVPARVSLSLSLRVCVCMCSSVCIHSIRLLDGLYMDLTLDTMHLIFMFRILWAIAIILHVCVHCCLRSISQEKKKNERETRMKCTWTEFFFRLHNADENTWKRIAYTLLLKARSWLYTIQFFLTVRSTCHHLNVFKTFPRQKRWKMTSWSSFAGFVAYRFPNWFNIHLLKSSLLQKSI